jgi:hypothetical protein
VHQWWTKRQENAAAKGDDPPRGATGNQPQAKRPRVAKNWEEDLRRLLEGETPPQAAPPPTVSRTPPQVRVTPEFVSRPVAAPSSPPPPPLPTVVSTARAPGPAALGIPGRRAASHLPGAGQAYHRGSHVATKVEQRLDRVGQQVRAHRGGRSSNVRSSDVVKVGDLLGSRESLRTAILASVILGPPKSLDPGEESTF